MHYSIVIATYGSTADQISTKFFIFYNFNQIYFHTFHKSVEKFNVFQAKTIARPTATHNEA